MKQFAIQFLGKLFENFKEFSEKKSIRKFSETYQNKILHIQLVFEGIVNF